MSFCAEVGRWAAGLRPELVPARVRERAELQRAAIEAAGAAGREAAAPFAAVAPEGPLGEVYAGAAASMAHDWDDYLFMGHTGHSAVWTAAAFAPDPERRLVAQIAANEVAGRLGAALLLGPHNGQFWASIHCAGGAVAAAVAQGLDADRTAHALAIALYQPPYGLWPGFMGPATKLLTAADPAVAGARAALLAAEGVDGPLDVVESPRGLLAHFAFAGRPSMLGALGDVWLTDTLAFKPVPGCAYLQAAVDAALAVGIAPGDVEAIDVRAGHLTCAMEELGAGEDLTPVRVGFSAALSVAVALIAGRLTHEEVSSAWLSEHAEEVRALARRVRVVHDWDATLRTLAGTIEAGVSLRDVGVGAWRRVLRRTRELGMDAGFDPSQLGALLREPRQRRELRRLLALTRRRATGLGALDTSRLRLTFPCGLDVSLRSGERVTVDGDEPGSCGRSVAEQRAVVAERQRAVGLEPVSVGAG